MGDYIGNIMSKRDYYEVLSVERTCTEIEIKKSYRVLAKKYHPDLNPGNREAEERFKEASEAYEVLKDPQKRKIYDQYGHQGLNQQGFQGFSNAEDIMSNFSDIFDSFFGFGGGGRGRRGGPSRGQDLQMQLGLTFEEAVFGVTKHVDVPMQHDCEACHGTGSEPGHEPTTCPTCQGYGQVQQNRGFLSIATTCPECRGQGKIISHPCKVCKGTKRIEKEEIIEVSIPAGIESGMQLRVGGKGQQGFQGGPAGDLYVQVVVEEHEKFTRHEQHLYAKLPIGLAQASLGCTMQVDTLEGKETLQIPKGTQNGDVLTLKGQGVPHLRSGRRGHLHYEAQVLIPKRLSTKQEQLLRDFAQESGERVNDPEQSFLDKLVGKKKKKK
jgi:molecular chaperone DnaJ